MKYIYVLSLISLIIFSCNQNENTIAKSKVFNALNENSITISSDYPKESIIGEKIIIANNDVNGKINKQISVLNFKTENLLYKIEVDSAELILFPIPEENIGENAINISLVNERFKNFTWNTPPKVDSSANVYVQKITTKYSKKPLKIDVTNLIKKKINNSYSSDFALYLDLDEKRKNKQTFSVFYSGKLKSKSPQLILYY